MKVLKEDKKGVSKGATIPLEEMGLPAKGANGLLLVFWKEM
jgi:hypothetical protein